MPRTHPPKNVTRQQIDVWANLLGTQAETLKKLSVELSERSIDEFTMLHVEMFERAIVKLPDYVGAAYAGFNAKAMNRPLRMVGTEADDLAGDIVSETIAARKKRRKKR